jgi:hypothetical protein
MAVTIDGAGPLAGATTLNGLTIPTTSFGKVLQVVGVIKQDLFSATSASYTDVTGLSVAITPASTSNKILVIASLSLVNTANQGWASGCILRDSTIIGGGTPSGSRQAASFFYRQTTSSIGDGQNPKSMTVLDSPSTISAITYKIQVRSSSPAAPVVAVNRGPMDDNATYGDRLASSIILMEISA